MISRRALLGSGTAVAAVIGAGAIANASHRFDDLARGAGLKPRPRPVRGDDILIAEVARDQNVLLALIEAVIARHADLAVGLGRFAQISQAQVEAVGGSQRVPLAPGVSADPTQAVAKLSAAYATASAARAKDAGRAVSPDLARVLSSMSAGLAQCAHTIGELR